MKNKEGLKLTKEFKMGYKNAGQGHSIHYNPFRHTGTGEQFKDWETGHRYYTGKEDTSDKKQKD